MRKKKIYFEIMSFDIKEIYVFYLLVSKELCITDCTKSYKKVTVRLDQQWGFWSEQSLNTESLPIKSKA